MKRHLGIFLRGLAIGAADVVPGVSGGTIAFITGIYFRLLGAISAIPSACWYSLFRGRPRRFWNEIDGTFLVLLLTGILCSVFSLASVITAGLEHYPVPFWSFFFGLIVASAWQILRQLERWKWTLLPLPVIGAIFVWWVTSLSVGQMDPTGFTYFWAGALAICAMILPGVSGSFVLLVIGMYAHVLGALIAFQVPSLLAFIAGCAIGIVLFARVLGVALRLWHDRIMALFTGFMLGALNRIWPWQEVEAWRTDSSGEQVPLSLTPVSPGRYSELTGEPALVGYALLAMLLGIGLVVSAEIWAAYRRRSQELETSGA